MRTRTIWIVHLVTLVNIVLGAMFDLRFESLVGAAVSTLKSPGVALESVVEQGGYLRVVAISIAMAVAAASLFYLLGRALGTSQNTRGRSIGSLLAITAVVAVWCSIASNHHSIAWQGKRVRLASQLETLESIVDPLRRDWPQRDGELENGGPFMAYPFGAPTTLILLQAPKIDSGTLCVNAVERSKDGAIKLQLNSPRHDDWAEWHPPSSRPDSFIGGLNDRHQIDMATSIGQGWYLVRYQNPNRVPPTGLVEHDKHQDDPSDYAVSESLGFSMSHWGTDQRFPNLALVVRQDL